MKFTHGLELGLFFGGSGGQDVDSGDEDFKVICPGTTGVVFIEIERDIYDLALLGKGSWTLGAGKDAVWEGGQTGKVGRL